MENKDQDIQILSSADREAPQVMYSSTKEAASDEISLKDLILRLKRVFNYLFSKKWVILLSIFFGALLGLIYANYKKPVYLATTTFVLESGEAGGGSLGQYAGIASMVGIDLGGGGGGIFQGDNILELYKSRMMIEQTLLSAAVIDGKNQLLIDRYLDFSNKRKKWLNKPELSKLNFNSLPATFSRLQDSIIGETVKDIKRNYLTVGKPDKKLSIINVEVKSIDEAFAKIFNEQIVNKVNDFYIQTKTKKSLENVTILQQKTDSVRAVMNGAIYSAASVSDATPNLNPTRQVQRTAPIQRSQFSAETNKAILSELLKNLEMSKMSLRKETPLIQVLDQPVFPLEKEEVGKATGVILGGALMALLTTLFLVGRRIYMKIMSS